MGCLFLLFVVVAFAQDAKIVIDSDKSQTTPFPHFWEECIGSGHAALALREDWQKAMKDVHDNLGFKRVRFHGLFDDDMNVVLPQGYSFYSIDQVFDYLFSIGVDPLVELSFMPELIASNTSETIMHYKGIISPPADFEKWVDLIKTFAEHLIERYGLDKVRTLNFEVWNEYNCGFLASKNPRQTYYDIFNATSFALKSVDSKLRVGGPVTCMSMEIDLFLSYIEHNNVAADFISSHFYPTDPNVNDGNPLPNVLKTLEQIRSSKNPDLPLYYTEYNDGLFFDPPLHDTPFASSYLVKLLSSINGAVPLMSWWTFSDIFEEQGMYAQEFDKSEGWGLLSLHSIAKPVYRAFQLLKSSGDARMKGEISSNDPNIGFLALTSADDEIDIFVWNNFFPNQKAENVTKGSTATVSISLANVKNSTTLQITRIDQNNANAPELWRQDGRPTYLSAEQIQKYQAVSQLQYTSAQCVVNGSVCTFTSPFQIPLQGLLVLSTTR